MITITVEQIEKALGVVYNPAKKLTVKSKTKKVATKSDTGGKKNTSTNEKLKKFNR